MMTNKYRHGKRVTNLIVGSNNDQKNVFHVPLIDFSNTNMHSILSGAGQGVHRD